MKRNDFKTNTTFLARFKRKLPLLTTILSITAFSLLMAGVAFASAEAGGASDASALNPLASWRGDLAIWTAVVFLGLVFILGKFAFKPIAKALDDREQTMHDRVAAAEKANADAKALLEQYQQKLASSDQEVSQLIAKAKEDAEKMADSIVVKAKEMAENEHKRALKEIESATDSALQELATKSADLATSLAGKILKKDIDSATHSELINGAISQFSGN